MHFLHYGRSITINYLPFGSIIEEDEQYVLISCPRYHEYLLNLLTDTKSLLLQNEEHHELYHWNHVKHLARCVKKIFSHRLPKTSKTTKKQNRTNTLDQDKDNGKPNSLTHHCWT